MVFGVFGKLECMVAVRYLQSRRKEGIISVIAGFSLVGIALGVATLIIVMAVMNGFRQELLSRILGVNGHLAIYDISGSIKGYDDLSRELLEIPGVLSATPQIQDQVMVTAKGKANGGLVRGMTQKALQGRSVVAEKIVSGDLADFTGEDTAVLGHRLAYSLSVGIGDSIRLISPESTITALGSVPRMKSFKVVATFDVGMYEYDSTFVYIPLLAAQRFFRLKDSANAIEVFLSNAEITYPVRRAIEKRLGPEKRVLDWQQSNASFFNAIQVERNVMFLILSLIILVAVFNIISGQIMLVKDKGKDIAILRTMGATPGMIMRIFFLSGASIGVVGTLVGFGLGLAFAENVESIRQTLQQLTGTELFSAEIYFLSQLPAEVDWAEVLQVVGMSLFFSFLAPVFPALRAARLDPVEALRYE